VLNGYFANIYAVSESQKSEPIKLKGILPTETISFCFAATFADL
jgi:hypothetical protein